jgi:hypothetical protein
VKKENTLQYGIKEELDVKYENGVKKEVKNEF